MLVKYIGGDPGGKEIPALGDRHFALNDPQEVPDEIGRSLCEQEGTWAEHKPAVTPPASPLPTPTPSEKADN